MATMTVEKQTPDCTPKVDAKSGFGFTLGLLLGAAAGGIFSFAVGGSRNVAVPESAIDLGRKVEQLRALKTTEVAE